MKHYYSARRYYGHWHGIVYYWANLTEDEVIVYKSGPVETDSDAYDAAKEWADEEGIEVEMD